jgi:dipicolinate synthase subunit B
MTIGFALCGSYCTFDKVFPVMEALAREHRVIPIFSENVQKTDSRFGDAADFYRRAFEITGTEPVCSILEAEPIGPKKLLDALVIAPCTGNTLGKLSHGITDTTITMAAKAHLRNSRPLIIAVSTNDGLAGAAENLGRLLVRKNVYFVPFGQDDPRKKPTSLVADFSRIPETVDAALQGRQIQPVLL